MKDEKKDEQRRNKVLRQGDNDTARKSFRDSFRTYVELVDGGLESSLFDQWKIRRELGEFSSFISHVATKSNIVWRRMLFLSKITIIILM